MKPESLTPKQIAQLLDTLAVLVQIGEAVKAHAIKQVHAGVAIPGYEASWTNTQRKWTDEEAANVHLTKLGLPTADRYNVTLKSPAQAEDTLKRAGKWPKKEKGTKKLEFTPLDKVVMQSEASPTIRRKAQ